MSHIDVVRVALGEAADLHRRVSDSQAAAIVEAALVMRQALDEGHHVWVFGNGGSAADAQHFATELVGRFARERRGLAVTALTSDTALITAVANDYGFEHVFARQIEAVGKTGDVAVGITTSGTSANVNRGLEKAREAGLRTIGLTGRDGGETGRLVDVHVNVPGVTSQQVQEVHRTVIHAMCELIERAHA